MRPCSCRGCARDHGCAARHVMTSPRGAARATAAKRGAGALAAGEVEYVPNTFVPPRAAPIAQVRCAIAARPPPSPAMRHVAATRAIAAEAYAMAIGRFKGTPSEDKPVTVMRQAVKFFREMCPDAHIRQPGRFILKWHGALAAQHDVRDAPGRGRKSALTDKAADAALAILYGGWKDSEKRQHCWCNLDHALAGSKELRRILRRCKLSPGQFWVRLKLRDPKLCIKKVTCKTPLAAWQRRERREAGRRLLALFGPGGKVTDYFKRVFWIDAKKMYFNNPKGCTVVCRIDDPVSWQYHPMKSWRKQDVVAVNYYAVVNWFAGPVMFVPVTGTTDLQTGFKVRGSALMGACS